MIDAATILNENTLSLSQAAKRLPAGRNGAPVSLACVLRWVLDGARAPDGQKVRLEAVRIGGRWITSIEALARFAEALTPRTADGPAPTRTPRQQRAEKELEQLGI
jgi:hypothetical protein